MGYREILKRMRQRETFRIILPTVFSFLLFIAFIFGGILPSFKTHIMDAKRQMIKNMVELVCAGLSYYQREVETGRMSLEEAQSKAMHRIATLHYGPEGKDYFWVNDLRGVMLMHPYRKDLVGKDVIDLRDKKGKYLIREFINVVKTHGEGYVDYMWQWKDDPNRIVPKLSFVKGFAPWGWIIGTGIYVE
ncbi:MAG: histidine kinase, partial [Deltaproteobacteria bacterium]